MRSSRVGWARPVRTDCKSRPRKSTAVLMRCSADLMMPSRESWLTRRVLSDGDVALEASTISPKNHARFACWGPSRDERAHRSVAFDQTHQVAFLVEVE